MEGILLAGIHIVVFLFWRAILTTKYSLASKFYSEPMSIKIISYVLIGLFTIAVIAFWVWVVYKIIKKIKG